MKLHLQFSAVFAAMICFQNMPTQAGPLAGCDFDNGSGVFDKTPDDLDALDSIAVSLIWTNTADVSEGSARSRPSAPLAFVYASQSATVPNVGSSPPGGGNVVGFSISIPSHVKLTITNITFSHSRDSSTRSNWMAFWTSLDSTLLYSAAGSVNTSWKEANIDFSGAKYQDLNNQDVVFYWSSGGATTSGNANLDSIVISGTYRKVGTVITLF